MNPIIYIVEDEEPIRDLYYYSLEGANFEPHCFSGGKELFLELSKAKADLIILDIMLPEQDGFSILKHLKSDKNLSEIPVILVSAMGDEVSKVKGLNLGADDYISKPFGVLELVARIKANLRKKPTTKSVTLSYKDILIDEKKRCLIVCKKEVATTLKEYKLMEILCNNVGKVIEREQIFVSIWGSDFMGETRTLDVHIKELRKKLEENNSVCEIKTVRGVGYMLI